MRTGCSGRQKFRFNRQDAKAAKKTNNMFVLVSRSCSIASYCTYPTRALLTNKQHGRPAYTQPNLVPLAAPRGYPASLAVYLQVNTTRLIPILSVDTLKLINKPSGKFFALRYDISWA